MTLQETFEQQWQSLSNVVASEMIKSEQLPIETALEKVDRCLSNELNRWNVPGSYQNIWLKNFRATNLPAVQAFEKALASFRLKRVGGNSEPSSAPMFVLALCGGGIGFALAHFLLSDASFMSTCVATVATAGVGAFIGKSSADSKTHEAFDKMRAEYMKQIAAKGKELSEIVAQADK